MTKSIGEEAAKRHRLGRPKASPRARISSVHRMLILRGALFRPGEP
jgi:hypothetical protein